MTPDSKKGMRYFSVTCEVWVKPLFKKSRLKNFTTTWAAHEVAQVYEMLREHYAGKRWKMVDIVELHTREVQA